MAVLCMERHTHLLNVLFYTKQTYKTRFEIISPDLKKQMFPWLMTFPPIATYGSGHGGGAILLPGFTIK